MVGKLGQKDAHPFQAPELPFYFMHARLWLLIALARIAPDSPKAIAKYKDALVRVVHEKEQPHVLMRHFAARTVLACADAGACKLPKATRHLLQNIDLSPHPRLQRPQRYHDDFYRGRPSEVPKAKFEFRLDYDFHKYDVQALSRVFGKAGWQLQDIISETVHSIDAKAQSMYENAGRELPWRQRMGGMTSRYHTYGQQLGWHALLLAAGHLFRDYPVTDDEFDDDLWDVWLSRYLLTRKDGLWLSDGMDWVPPGRIVTLLEKGQDGLVLTGDKAKIWALVGLDTGIKKELIVAGHWHSADEINVRIESALVKRREARAVAKHLIEQEPMLAWLPFYSEDSAGDDYLMNGKDRVIPWLVQPSPEGRLDESDPIGSIDVLRRPRIARVFAEMLNLSTGDPFDRIWKDRKRRVVSRSAVWGGASDYGDNSGVHLTCSSVALKELLAANDADLLLLIRLERREPGLRHEAGKYIHTLAAVRVTSKDYLEYYQGHINRVHKFQH